MSDSFIKKSPCNGKITSITPDYIEVTCTGNKKEKIDLTPVHLRSGSGKDALSVFKPTIIKGQAIKKDNVIAEGSCISQGTISLGKNLLAAVMPYKGYNFEDGIVISDAVVGKMISLHGIIEEVFVSENDRVLEIIELGAKTKKG